MRIPVITCASGASWDGQVQEESSRAAQRGRKRQRPTLNVQNRYSNLVEGSMLFPWSTTNEIHRVDMYTWKMSSDRLYSCTHAAPVGLSVPVFGAIHHPWTTLSTRTTGT